ncbi:MAG: hypothetical protein JNL67_11410 [Planctomycetaceae bacterium]|nr:hypothetical protein [Planctomycetaceae bacterium]
MPDSNPNTCPPRVDIEFDCLPLRSTAGRTLPLDASPGLERLWSQLRQAAEKHGTHNSYFLNRGRCRFHLTNHPQLGQVTFAFSGVVLTDGQDQRTVSSELHVELEQETCDWLEQPIVTWLAKTVIRAVEIEFDRYIHAGDLARTQQRLAELEQQAQSSGGYLGMYL